MNSAQLFGLKDRVAIVTGGSRGLGLQIAIALGEAGAKIAIVARKQAELGSANEALRRLGIEVVSITADLQQLDQIPAVVDVVMAAYGKIDILVNNAGTTWVAPAESYPDKAWQKVMSLNADVPFFLSREVANRSMIPNQSGKIINIASVAGLKGSAPGMTQVAYNTSKAALINQTRALASEWGRHNINVNVICPGFFPTKLSAGTDEKALAAIVARTPLRRMGGDDDLKGPVLFFASDAAKHVTGQCIAVDGGSSIT